MGRRRRCLYCAGKCHFTKPPRLRGCVVNLAMAPVIVLYCVAEAMAPLSSECKARGELSIVEDVEVRVANKALVPLRRLLRLWVLGKSPVVVIALGVFICCDPGPSHAQERRALVFLAPIGWIHAIGLWFELPFHCHV